MTRSGVRFPWHGVLAGAMSALLVACGSTLNPAPIFERSPSATNGEANIRSAAEKLPGSKAPSKPAPRNAATAANSPANPPAIPPAGNTNAGKPTAVNSSAANPPAGNINAGKPPSAVETHLDPAPQPAVKPYRDGDWRPEFHIVRKGDTLYSIALDYGCDYRELAAWNDLTDPGVIRIDQRLRLFPKAGVAETASALPAPPAAPAPAPVYSEPRARKLPYSDEALAQFAAPATATGATTPPSAPAGAQAPAKSPPVSASPAPSPKEAPAGDAKLVWEWPAQGKLLYAFGQGANQKGVGIGGARGQPVMAAAPGKVVYSGSGLRGYGKLIIIKHNASFLSVYAHNSQLLVKEGQSVAKGQKIAEIGDTDSDLTALHFEIRLLGKPINPLQYLPEPAS